MIKIRLVIFIALLILFACPTYSLADEPISRPLHNALEKAQSLMAMGEYGKASNLLEEFRKKNDDQHYLLDFIQGAAYLEQAKPSLAKARFAACIRQKPDYLPAWQNLARCWFDLGDMPQAADNYMKAYALSNPKEPDLLYYAAACLASGGDYPAALEAFRRLMAEHKSQARLEWKEALVQTLIQADKQGESLPVLEEIIREATGDRKRRWQEVLLYQYAELGMDKKAVAYVHALLDEYPEEPLWWKTLWRLHLNQGRYKEALAGLVVYSFFQPLTPKEIELAGDLYSASGVPGKAAGFYGQALKNKQDPDVILKIAGAFHRIGKLQEALDWLDKALEQDQKSTILLSRAYILYDMKNYSKAATAFKTAAPQAKKPGQAWLMAGFAAYNANNLGNAKDFLKNAEKYQYSKKTASTLLSHIMQQEDS
ncbi:TPR repeat-containing protein [Desulfatibacillum alkenivorans DSM 16219]|jgi:tetratricopeptide (TPR) repeat protein|uniref:TPR repeat-containing protein n=1 Tax=Desulfatibacillum alkenivorans DSM 16219 TaxID=1121393 RepID=A0A1M6JSW0_9BACT|nr:tetratricopeptide repeat protein [Desulfatibacillum alkenivorans]SHJ49702.1 TPR repeat-containing protein [Desulfatibacillum alkenivorans DSM 16219]